MLKGIFYLMLLVLLHELGHFAVARFCGVKVNEFSIGFGPTILKHQGKKTRYSLRLIPLGGYCALEGENEDSDDPHSFRNASDLKRILILLAGPGMNFIIGIILIGFLMLINAGPAYANMPDRIDTGAIQPTDEIVQVDDFHIFTMNDIMYAELFNKTGQFDVTIRRDGEKIELEDYKPVASSLLYEGKLNIVEDTIPSKIIFTARSTASMCQNVLLSVKHLFMGDFALKDMSGPVGIAHIFDREDSMTGTLTLIAFISINLGIMNLLPLPVLDGGQIFLILLQKIFRKKFNEKVLANIQFACFVILFGLLAFVSVSDIIKLF